MSATMALFVFPASMIVFPVSISLCKNVTFLAIFFSIIELRWRPRVCP